MAVKMSNRKFGVEIEFCTDEYIGWWASKLSEKTGLPVSANGSFKNGWVLVEDGSVEGWELVSPILSGNDGIRQVKKMTAAIKTLGGWMDDACGFHVHVDARDFTFAQIMKATELYSKHEQKLDEYVSETRRENYNEYCGSVDQLLERLRDEEVESLRQLTQAWIGRYHKFNVAAYAKHGTLEFRHHEGSLDIAKIINWIKFCVRYMENVKHGRRFSGPSKLTRETSRSYPVIAKLLVDGAGKTTTKEVATNLNVSENTVSKYISLFRRKFKLDIKAEGNLYYVHGVTPASLRRQLLAIAA